jgi:hypothetical protein
MTETELWEWMMDGKNPPGYPDIDHPEIVPLERKALATLSREIVMTKWQGHNKPEKKVKVPAGTRVKVVMVSRMGDVGITDNLKADTGYHYRVICLKGEFDVFGDGKQIVPTEPENLLLDIEPIEDPKVKGVK